MIEDVILTFVFQLVDEVFVSKGKQFLGHRLSILDVVRVEETEELIKHFRLDVIQLDIVEFLLDPVGLEHELKDRTPGQGYIIGREFSARNKVGTIARKAAH